MRIGDASFMDSSLRKSVPLGSTTPANQAAREALEREMNDFLSRGGRITVVPGFNPPPLHPHRPPRRAQEEPEQDDCVRGKGRRAIPWPEAVTIKDRLFSAELTYKQLAELTGVPRHTLANWFQKTMIPSHAWKLRIAEALQTLLAMAGKAQPKAKR